jgi:hypothetical protein
MTASMILNSFMLVSLLDSFFFVPSILPVLDLRAVLIAFHSFLNQPHRLLFPRDVRRVEMHRSKRAVARPLFAKPAAPAPSADSDWKAQAKKLEGVVEHEAKPFIQTMLDASPFNRDLIYLVRETTRRISISIFTSLLSFLHCADQSDCCRYLSTCSNAKLSSTSQR